MKELGRIKDLLYCEKLSLKRIPEEKMGANIYKVIETIKSQTGIALADAFGSLNGQKYSENDLANSWLNSLRKHDEFYQEGWYAPPPSGIISIFGNPSDRFARICQSSFRPQHMWPCTDLHYDNEDIIAVYASPVHRETKLIGDFGLNLYRGNDAAIHDHCEKVLRATLSIAQRIKVGMPFKEIYLMAMDYGASQGFVNNIASPTDKTGTNAGHTIPLSYETDPTHQVISKLESFEDVRQAISKGRKFINSEEEQRVEENIAFTIEPRFSTDTMPNTWFHLTVIFENGKQRICHGFRPVMQKFSMDKLIELLPS